MHEKTIMAAHIITHAKFDLDFLFSIAVVRVLPQVLHGRAAPADRPLRPLLGRAAGREKHQRHLPLLSRTRQEGLPPPGMHRRPQVRMEEMETTADAKAEN